MDKNTTGYKVWNAAEYTRHATLCAAFNAQRKVQNRGGDGQIDCCACGNKITRCTCASTEVA